MKNNRVTRTDKADHAKSSDEIMLRRKRKHIQCPKCGTRIIDAALTTVAELRPVPAKPAQQADFYMKCKNCSAELGLKKLG